ncbi:AAA family ATPase [Actinacidiphila rubida]|uniref:AAA domain-containing protein n=1 Tax=Actinacidiphila rubida TaxID=310780 RepID=A0A1H8E8C3_9ACTN|nr:AAA family ATPase [Actinacidiphila rubida]SEN15650.1 AAA domain-containing protein [Actinacidiphila rubida]
MKIAVSGTYSSGKTSTVMALSHYTGVPRSLARTIREIMPETFPGLKLVDVTPAQFLQLTMRRHTGRAVQEALLGDTFVSDGSSLQEWLYGAGRVRFNTMNPNATAGNEGGRAEVAPEEMAFFAKVVDQYGQAFKKHVKDTYDAYVHLRHELSITADGHRPMNKAFRAAIDTMLLETLDELEIPYHVVGGTMPERLEAIAGIFDLKPVMSTAEAIELARNEYGRQDFRMETERVPAQA